MMKKLPALNQLDPAFITFSQRIYYWCPKIRSNFWYYQIVIFCNIAMLSLPFALSFTLSLSLFFSISLFPILFFFHYFFLSFSLLSLFPFFLSPSPCPLSLRNMDRKNNIRPLIYSSNSKIETLCYLKQKYFIYNSISGLI